MITQNGYTETYYSDEEDYDEEYSLYELKINFLKRLDHTLRLVTIEEIQNIKNSFKKFLIKKNLSLTIPENNTQLVLLIFKTVRRFYPDALKETGISILIEKHRKDLNISKDDFIFLFEF